MATPDPSAQGNPESTAPRPRHLLNALIVVLVIGVAVFVYTSAARSRDADDALHGDAEEAVGAVAGVVRSSKPGDLQNRLLALSDDPNPGTRYAAVDALGNVPGERSIARVEAAFHDSASIVRQRAMEVLLDLDRERGLRCLLSALRDEDTWIREAAIQQCSTRVNHKRSVLDRRAVPVLVGALDDPVSTAMPALAAGVLRHITGQPWRFRGAGPEQEKRAAIARWKGWWAANAANWRIPPEYAAPPVLRPTRTDPAPAFSLRDIDGKGARLETQRGRVTLLNFWGTWCPPCAVELPALASIDSLYRARGVDVIGIALSETGGPDALRKWCQAHGVGYRQCLATPDVLDAYGHIHEVPVSVLIDQQGRIRYRWEGERDLPTFRAAIERLLGPDGR